MIAYPIAYPLTLRFKFFAFAPQCALEDANGRTVAYIKQKLFKLRESVSIYSDASMTHLLYKVDADRVLDIGARYHISRSDGSPVGVLKRQGMRSIWRAYYDILPVDAMTPRTPAPTIPDAITIREENPWVKVIDGLIGEIPILGMFVSGFLFHPAYLIQTSDGAVAMRLVKRSSFIESLFSLEKNVDMNESIEERVLLGVMIMVLLERERG